MRCRPRRAIAVISASPADACHFPAYGDPVSTRRRVWRRSAAPETHAQALLAQRHASDTTNRLMAFARAFSMSATPFSLCPPAFMPAIIHSAPAFIFRRYYAMPPCPPSRLLAPGMAPPARFSARYAVVVLSPNAAVSAQQRQAQTHVREMQRARARKGSEGSNRSAAAVRQAAGSVRQRKEPQRKKRGAANEAWRTAFSPQSNAAAAAQNAKEDMSEKAAEAVRGKRWPAVSGAGSAR